MFCALTLCELEPCVFGHCTLTANGYRCQCQPGYIGVTCEQKQRPCEGNPCEGRGDCIGKYKKRFNLTFFCNFIVHCLQLNYTLLSKQYKTIENVFNKYLQRFSNKVVA